MKQANSKHSDFGFHNLFHYMSEVNNYGNTIYYHDLHGFSVGNAEKEVERMIKQAHFKGYEYARIVTGRGNHINNKGERGVIFRDCEKWLKKDSLTPLIQSYDKRDGHYIVTLNVKRSAKFDDGFASMFDSFRELDLAEYQSKAQKNDVEAQFQLGTVYQCSADSQDDKERAKKFKLAFKWFMAAAKQNHPLAQERVGLCYLIGEGVRQNDSLAIEWLTKAAEHEQAPSPGAAYNLYSIYFGGWGVDVDLKLAICWAVKSARLGSVLGMRCVGDFYFFGIVTPKNLGLAYEWYLKAAQLNDEHSQTQLGVMYENGMGVPVDLKKAFEWHELAAKNGDPDGMANLALAYLYGKGCITDLDNAKTWFLAAENSGHTEAGYILKKHFGDIKQDSNVENSLLFQQQLYFTGETKEIRAKAFAFLSEQELPEIRTKLQGSLQFLIAFHLLDKKESSKKKQKANYQKAIDLLERLVKDGNQYACNLLGFECAKSDLKKAATYWETGAKLGDPNSLFFYFIYITTTKKEPGNNQLISDYLKKAMELNHPCALFVSGMEKFRQGNLFVIKDEDPNPKALADALEIFETLLTEMGKQKTTSFFGLEIVRYKTAYMLSIIYPLVSIGFRYDPKIGERYLELSKKLLEYAAEAGYANAQCTRGVLDLTHGNLDQGIIWLNLAAEQNFTIAKDVILLYEKFINYQISDKCFGDELSNFLKKIHCENEKISFTKSDLIKTVQDYHRNKGVVDLDKESEKSGSKQKTTSSSDKGKEPDLPKSTKRTSQSNLNMNLTSDHFSVQEQYTERPNVPIEESTGLSEEKQSPGQLVVTMSDIFESEAIASDISTDLERGLSSSASKPIGVESTHEKIIEEVSEKEMNEKLEGDSEEISSFCSLQ